MAEPLPVMLPVLSAFTATVAFLSLESLSMEVPSISALLSL